MLGLSSCDKEWLELRPIATELEEDFYSNEEEIFQGLVSTYDVLQWGGSRGWTMNVGLLNAASDDAWAGGSGPGDQPNWVAYDNFTLTDEIGPQEGVWAKYYAGLYRANLLLGKIEEVEGLDANFKARTIAELKFLRAFFHFDLVRYFGNIVLADRVFNQNALEELVQTDKATVYAFIEQDLNDALSGNGLPETVPPDELGRITFFAAKALLGKVILFQNDDSKMKQAADQFEDVINSQLFMLNNDFEDIYNEDNEFGPESVFEIVHSNKRAGGWGNFSGDPVSSSNEGNYNVQFFGMRDYSGPTYASGWSFNPVTVELVEFMGNDPRAEHTIIDGNELKNQGAAYTEGFQNTDYFVKKFAPIQEDLAPDGETALNWGLNVKEIRYADVLLMAAEALVRSGGDQGTARGYVNEVRQRVGIQPLTGNFVGDALLDAIYNERRMELATEGHRFFDLVRTGRAAEVLADKGFQAGVHEVLPIPFKEIELTGGTLVQNPGY